MLSFYLPTAFISKSQKTKEGDVLKHLCAWSPRKGAERRTTSS